MIELLLIIIIIILWPPFVFVLLGLFLLGVLGVAGRGVVEFFKTLIQVLRK